MMEPASPLGELAKSIDIAINPRPAAPGFVAVPREKTEPVRLAPSFIDRCRQAFLSIEFTGGSRVIGVSGVGIGDARAVVAIGIATAMAADTGDPTALVECDFDMPRLAQMFKITEGPGLVDWLEESDRLRVLPMSPLANAFVIPAGAARSDSGHLFYRLTQSQVTQGLRAQFRNVVMLLPPLRNITHSSVASSLCDNVLLVAQYGVTPIDELEQAIFLLGHERLSGVVIAGYAPHTPSWLRRLF